MTTIHALPPDTQLGNYRLLEPIGRGGFGLTYMAWDEKLERSVVIKECFPTELCVRDEKSYHIRPAAPELEADYTAALESIGQEARILASQNHEHIVRVYDIFEAFGSIFYVMPHLEGGSLLARMVQAEESGTPIASELVTGWLNDILSALSYLHERKLYHRDIKPSNILFDEQDRPVLIDFGAALNMPDVTRTITQGVFTIAYAAPEQITNKGQIGPWTDYYALAATWYRLICGTCVERADARLMQDDVAPLSSLPQSKDYAPNVIQAIERNLSLPIAQRFQSPEDWASTMQGKVPPAPKAQRQSPPKTWFIVGGVVILAILGFALELQEKLQSNSNPSQESAFSPIAARISTSRLDQLKEDVEDLAYKLQLLEANYMMELNELFGTYTKELPRALNRDEPFYYFDYALLDKERTQVYKDWEEITVESKELNQAWQTEMARLEGLNHELNEDDRKFFIETLAVYKKSWDSKYSKELPTDTPPESFERNYTDTRENIEKYTSDMYKNKDAYGSKK